MVTSAGSLFPASLQQVSCLPSPNSRQRSLHLIALLAITYIIRQTPAALPRRLSTKVAKKLADIDYVHANALRISGSVRKVLRFPADKLRIDLDSLVKDLAKRRDDSLHVRD